MCLSCLLGTLPSAGGRVFPHKKVRAFFSPSHHPENP